MHGATEHIERKYKRPCERGNGSQGVSNKSRAQAKIVRVFRAGNKKPDFSLTAANLGAGRAVSGGGKQRRPGRNVSGAACES